MKTKFNVGEEVYFKIQGTVRRISIDKTGICYTIIIEDNYGNRTDLYIDESALGIIEQNEKI